ncbi:unnamed protein product [Moneuplotes crassus]|uniref:Protein-lysine N-methyltransferase ECRASSUSDP1_LOCUS19582 n=1 Tax=Euplotes crassus TaxID=5936 RepID=A0AAD2D308_EUPCR|nr:unnamed protein product [Moneuplotes crassus]
MEERTESTLTKKETWDSTFDHEILNFEDTGDEGEVWFGEDVQQKAIDYIQDNFSAKDMHVLDVGTGNAAFLIACREELDLENLTGIDYSEKSIELSQKILNAKFGDDNIITVKQGDAFEYLEEEKEKYTIVHDKGTFDVIYMMSEDNNHDYVKAIHFRMKPEENSRLIITSCNCTGSELDGIFLKEDYFEKVEEIKGYRTMKFGGVIGQNVSTCVYKPLRKE